MASHRVEGNRFRFGRARRVLTVSLSAAITVVLFAGYVIGDVNDVVPGYLTYAQQESLSDSLPDAAASVEASSPVGSIDTDKAISVDAATKLVKKFTSTEDIGSNVSVVIADGDGKEIVSKNATTAREPASTLKTLTALAVSEKLDMRATLDTQVYVTNETDSSATIVLRGSGDMMLGSGHSDSAHINGHAGLATLADSAVAALKKKGISKVSVAYDDSLLGTKRMPSNMDDSMIGNGNFAPVASMAVDEGRQWGKSTKPSDPDALLAWLPSRTTQPAKSAAQTFVGKVKSAGMKVTGSLSSTTLSKDTTEDSSALIASVSSAQLWQVLRYTLQQSDNTLAELFGRLVALKTGEENSPSGAVSAVMKTLEKNGIDTTGLSLSDCSGLSDHSKLTAKALIQTQEKYFTTANAAALEGLGVSGFSGTALERSFGDSNRGLIRLKTGSLDTTTSMTGNVVRKNGGMLFFAVIVNKPDNMWSARTAVDSFVGSLTNL